MPENTEDKDYYYSLINKNIEKTFSFEQKKAIKDILGRAAPVPSRKLIDFRVHFWFIKRLYFVIFLGMNKRKLIRPFYSKSISLLNFAAGIFIIFFMIFILLLILFSIAYTVKSAFGIDAFSAFHLRDLARYLFN